MFSQNVDAHVHFRHTEAEVARLNKAIVPLFDNIRAVAAPNERGSMTRILNQRYFRRRDAQGMYKMLLRAAKHAKANLADYFPMMRQTILEHAQELEDAVTEYWALFEIDIAQTEPTH